MAERYQGKPVSVIIGQQKTVELPPRVFRGHVTGAMFDVDKSFLLPDAVGCVREIVAFCEDHPKLSILVVGHTDRIGSEDHNRKLSEERAKAVAAFLTDDVDVWLGFYNRGHTGKPWGRLEDQVMLDAVGDFTGIANGAKGRRWTAAIAAFGGKADDLDQASRRKLVTKYMKQARTSLLEGTNITTHGCGESHPLDTASREAIGKDRRVEIFLFEGPIEPAPAAACPAGGCAQYAQWGKRSQPLEHLGAAPGVDATIAVEWPADVVARLPRDTRVTLTPEGQPALALDPGDATVEHGMARFEFRMPAVPATTRLEATAGGKTVVLWEDRALGDVAVEAAWAGALEELLPAEPEDERGGARQISTSADALPPLPELG